MILMSARVFRKLTVRPVDSGESGAYHAASVTDTVNARMAVVFRLWSRDSRVGPSRLMTCDRGLTRALRGTAFGASGESELRLKARLVTVKTESHRSRAQRPVRTSDGDVMIGPRISQIYSVSFTDNSNIERCEPMWSGNPLVSQAQVGAGDTACSYCFGSCLPGLYRYLPQEGGSGRERRVASGQCQVSRPVCQQLSLTQLASRPASHQRSHQTWLQVSRPVCQQL
jgi:hypothetical protein